MYNKRTIIQCAISVVFLWLVMWVTPIDNIWQHIHWQILIVIVAMIVTEELLPHKL